MPENHFAQIRFFVAFWRKYPNDLPNEIKSARYLWAFKDGNPENMCWYSPLEIALDTPYEETGLAEFSSVHGKAILWPGYLEKLGKNTSHHDFVSFLKTIGVANGLKIFQRSTYGNPQMPTNAGETRWRVTVSDYEIDTDWEIEMLSSYFATRDASACRLIWMTIVRADKEVARARWRLNSKYPVTESDSRLVQCLKAAAWIPDKDGVFHKPQDMTRELLPDDFTYDDRNGLLTAIGFEENARKRSAEHEASQLKALEEEQEREMKAQDAGFDNSAKLEEAKDLLKAKEEGRIRILRPDPEFPDSPVPDPARRSAKVAAEAAAAPAKTYETRTRNVRTSKGGVDAVPYLTNHYTAEDGRMACQCCHREMPFKKRDGRPYFEAVEAFGRDEVDKEHPAQHLALCPLCAAKYKEFVKRDDAARQALKDAVQEAPNGQREFDITLDAPARLRFTEKHVIDLRAILSTYVSTGV